MLGPNRVRPGDVLIGLASPGLRCNGYTLARHVLLERAGLHLDAPAWPGAPVTLADELLRPSVIYTPAVRAAIAAPAAGASGTRRRPHHRRRLRGQRAPGPARGAPGRGRPGDVGGSRHLR